MSITEEKKKEQLKKLNSKESRDKYRPSRRWHTPLGKLIKISHIVHTSRQLTIHPSMELRRRVEKMYKYNPQYKNSYETSEGPAKYLVMLGVFHLLGHLPTPLYPYIMYILWSDWKEQQKFRDSKKKQKIIMYYIDSFHILGKLLEEAAHWIDNHPDKLEHITPTYNPSAFEELRRLKEANTNGEIIDYGYN